NEEVARRATQVAEPKRGKVVFPGKIPEDEVYRPVAQHHCLLVDLYADSGQVGLGEDALDEALHQAGLADRKATHHADLLLDGQRHGSSSSRTVTVTRRVNGRALFVWANSGGVGGAAPPAVRPARRAPRCFTEA